MTSGAVGLIGVAVREHAALGVGRLRRAWSVRPASRRCPSEPDAAGDDQGGDKEGNEIAHKAPLFAWPTACTLDTGTASCHWEICPVGRFQ